MTGKRVSDQLAVLATVGWLLAAPMADAQGLPSVYLVQNSGWMEPYFHDERYDFRSFVRTLIDATHPRRGGKPQDSPVILASFNQDGQVLGENSPHVLYEGPRQAGRIAQAVNSLRLPFKLGGPSYADADFRGALLRTISELLKGKSGIIWFVTNNKNAPDNDQNVVQNTAGFFRILSDEDAIVRVVAYPIAQAVQGRKFSASGFIVYGIAYGRRAGELLAGIAADARVTGELGIRGATLKPLKHQPINFIPTTVDADDARAALVRGVLVLDALSADEPQTVTITGRLHSNYYPQVIDSATIRTRWQGEGEGAVQLSVSPNDVSGLSPDGFIDGVRLTLKLPAVARPGGWKGYLADETSMKGILEIQLTDLRLGLQPAFGRTMESVFGMDSLPEIFFAHRNTVHAVTRQPVNVRLVYSAGPLIAATSVGGVVLIAFAGILFWLLHRREHRLWIDGERCTVRLRPLESTNVDGDDERKYRVRASLLGTAKPTLIKDHEQH